MIQKYNRFKILRVFLDYPRKSFQLREISRNVKLGLPSVRNHIKTLEKGGFVIKEKGGIYPSFKANRDYELFKIYRIFDVILRIHESGLIKYVYDKCTPDAIILFGSASKGEDTEESDIDLFVQAPQRRLSLGKYEKALNRRISLFFEESFSKLSNELKNNILNGIAIKGYIKVF